MMCKIVDLAEEIRVFLLETVTARVFAYVTGKSRQRTTPPYHAVIIAWLPERECGVVKALADGAGALRFEGTYGGAKRFLCSFCYMQYAVEVIRHDAESGSGNGGVIFADVVPGVIHHPAGFIQSGGIVGTGAKKTASLVGCDCNHVEVGGTVVLKGRARQSADTRLAGVSAVPDT